MNQESLSSKQIEDSDEEPLKSRQLKASTAFNKEKYAKDYSHTTLESSASEVAAKLANGCECNVSCFLSLDVNQVYKHRLSIAELTKNELDFYLMGLVRASLMDVSDKGAKRQRKRSSYSYLGKKVCLYAFLYLENITIYQLKKIRSHLIKHGVTQIQHGNSHKVPHNAFSLDVYKRVELFLRNHLKTDRNHSNKSIVLTEPLSKVYQLYRNQEKKDSKMGYTTFRSFFRKQFPHVKLSNQLSKQQSSMNDRNTMTVKDICHEIEIIEEEHLEDEEENDGNKIVNDQHEIVYSNTDDLIYYDTSELSHEEIIN
ncbi:hypothetical protein PVAND_006955 [Polypedilum vanderplanki]|uniref:Uncharacterized protein n=1 Tax=Polypedilum vanderplanki TaxID=319348 RepID=A0A9J6C6E3_POLVA|nr:hypothetical protein PVAND_006955 [Polypedilum vanderplanki]